MKRILLGAFLICSMLTVTAQEKNAVIENMIKEANENSQLEILGHHMMDVIGPRLVGTPQMKQAHDWAVATYDKWGISAKNEQYGEWKAWERGITHIDMVYPRVQTLPGIQLSWSPSTGPKGVTAEVINLPTVKDPAEFKNWLKNAKGKFVMVSEYQITGRPDYNWEEFATPESFEKMKNTRDSISKAFRENIGRTGYDARSIINAIEDAGAVGIVSS